MTDQEVREILKRENLKNGEYVLLSYISAAGKTITFVSRLSIIEENGVLMISVGYLVSRTTLKSYTKLRRANLFDKMFRRYKGNSSDYFPSFFRKS